jgi:DHA1 family multidrug resistance protein-like MFS transporter
MDTVYPSFSFICYQLALAILFKGVMRPLHSRYQGCFASKKPGNLGVHAKQEVELDIGNLIEKYLTRPLRLLVTEPVLLLISLYMSFIYSLMYALLEAYPYDFGHIYGMQPGVAGLTFISLIVGILLGLAFILSQR